MSLKTHTLDLTDRVAEIDRELEEIEETKESILQDVDDWQQRHSEDESLPTDWEDDWEEADNEEVTLKGERKKIIEAILCYSDDTNIVDVDPSQCTGTERSIKDVNEDELDELYQQVDSCAFVVDELTFGQLQSVSDDMMEESFDVDVAGQEIDGTPQEGYYQLKLLQEAIIQWPAHAPVSTTARGAETASPGEYPIPIGEWLYEKVDALNTRGETSMGNSSLEEAMKLRD